MTKFDLISTPQVWMEGAALSQLEGLSRFPKVIKAVGLPDLHAGKSPIGVAVACEGWLYPYWVGGDIGCGLTLFQTGLPLKKLKLDKWENKLKQLATLADLPWDMDAWPESPISDLGTIGGGNHFAEFLQVEEIFLPETAASLSLASGELYSLIHAGSRGLGESILRRFAHEKGVAADSPEGRAYLEEHNRALHWGRINRQQAAWKLCGWLGFKTSLLELMDCPHNFVEMKGNMCLHRKGATSATRGPVIIPGSRGSLTYVVKPLADTAKSLWSLAHGAGRKWSRSMCKSRLKNKYDYNTIKKTALKSRVVCRDADLLFQEAPEAYKNIDTVIGALKEHGLIEVVATLRPLLTYKG